MGKNSAVLLPAEEITDPDNESGEKWIPEIDEDISEEFYPQEVDQNIQTERKEKKEKKKKKAKSTSSKQKSLPESDSEEEETITMETADWSQYTSTLQYRFFFFQINKKKIFQERKSFFFLLQNLHIYSWADKINDTILIHLHLVIYKIISIEKQTWDWNNLTRT